MNESRQRWFADQRSPEIPISEIQLRQEYNSQAVGGDIEPDMTFGAWLYNCMEEQGGTLRELSVPQITPGSVCIDADFDIEDAENPPVLSAYAVPLFDVDARLGTHVNGAPDNHVTLLIWYSPVYRTVRAGYIVDTPELCKGPYLFDLEPDEQEVLMEAMEGACRKAWGYSCAEYLLLES